MSSSQDRNIRKSNSNTRDLLELRSSHQLEPVVRPMLCPKGVQGAGAHCPPDIPACLYAEVGLEMTDSGSVALLRFVDRGLPISLSFDQKLSE